MGFETLSPATVPANRTYLTCLMAALDLIEEAAGLMPGGRTDAINRLGLALEGEVLAVRSSTDEERLWKAQRMIRAVENEWSAESAMLVAWSLETDHQPPQRGAMPI